MIGIFDSGVGGLTVVKEIKKELPNIPIIYFGDTARLPYGNKSQETIQRYSAEMNLAQQAYAEGRVVRALSLLERHIPGLASQEDLRGFEWRYLDALCRPQALFTFTGESSAIFGMACSPDGRCAAASRITDSLHCFFQ